MTRANVIVTFNLKDFPDEAISSSRLHTKHPDEFLLDAYSLSPIDFIEAVRDDFLHYRKPSLSFDEYIASLEKAGVPRLAEEMKPFKVLIVEGLDGA